MPEKNASNAASPPAEAPMPTIGKLLGITAAGTFTAEAAGSRLRTSDRGLAFLVAFLAVMVSHWG